MKNYVDEWREITNDTHILDIVEHCHIDLELNEHEYVKNVRVQYNFNQNEQDIVGKEIRKLLDLQVIIEVEPRNDQILSPIFLKPKKNGEYRMVLNLKKLNEYIPYKHFKMETFENALTLISKGSYMASVDLRHAYYSIQIAEEQQKYFRFTWNDKIYQFTCLVNGVSEGPRIFTKLMKPVYAKLRSLGFINSGFIDDSLLCGDSFDECTDNVNATDNLMTRVGFILNKEKSVFIPTTRIQYLGNIIDSEQMVVFLPESRQESILVSCRKLVSKSTTSIREVAKVIGLLVASFSAVEYGKLHYRHLEREKIQALKLKHGNFDALMQITKDMKIELKWWIDNLTFQVRHIIRESAKVTMYTDASLTGWGAKLGNSKIGGRWNDFESKNHINVLELLAISHALKAFQEQVQSHHVKIFSDNTTAVSYINNMGGTKSFDCSQVSVNIWEWCIKHSIWLTCAHIAGSKNVVADEASRRFNDQLEWKLDERIFHLISSRWGEPDVDLFASRLNAQVKNFCSWKPDPECSYVDSFSLAWNTFHNVYLFPPFSILGRCMQKIRADEARGIVIAPLWPTQPWFSRLMELLVEVPVIIRKRKGLLKQPFQNVEHPLMDRMKIMACKVSGVISENVVFQDKLQVFSCPPGNKELKNNITYSSRDGFHTVLKGKSLHFLQLWKK